MLPVSAFQKLNWINAILKGQELGDAVGFLEDSRPNGIWVYCSSNGIWGECKTDGTSPGSWGEEDVTDFIRETGADRLHENMESQQILPPRTSSGRHV